MHAYGHALASFKSANGWEGYGTEAVVSHVMTSVLTVWKAVSIPGMNANDAQAVSELWLCSTSASQGMIVQGSTQRSCVSSSWMHGEARTLSMLWYIVTNTTQQPAK